MLTKRHTANQDSSTLTKRHIANQGQYISKSIALTITSSTDEANSGKDENHHDKHDV